MKAVRIRDIGGPEVLRVDELPVPEPASGDSDQGGGGGWLAGPDRVRAAAENVLRSLAAGQLRVPIAATYRFDEAAAAHAAVEGRTTDGKVVLTPWAATLW